MILSNKELIEEFYELNKDKYPGLSLEQFKEICHAPWRYMKHEIESGELSEIRLKYFGVFRVYPGRAEKMLENLKTRFSKQQIEPKEYFRLKEMLEKFLKDESFKS